MNPPHQNFIRATCGPLSLEFLGYDSVAAYDHDAGYPGACLADALQWRASNETIKRFDKFFTPWVESLSGIPRQINEIATAKERSRGSKAQKKPILESVYRYMARVCALRPDLERQIKDEALRQSRSFRISSAPGVPPCAIEPSYLKRATSWLAQDLPWIDERLSPMLALLPEYHLDREASGKPELESLARLMQKHDNAVAASED